MLQVQNISKRYKTGDLEQVALNNVSVSFRDNEFVAVLGPSGSGKTTLLNIVGGLDRYDEGDLIINGVSTKEYSDRDWDAYRNHTIGFVFQSYNLIPHQTVLQNVELALTISGVSAAEKKQRAEEALEKVGLGGQGHKKPNQMSGGQMQRVAIARALVNNPDIILADEPTGALDSKTSVQIMDLLKEVADDRLVVMVTHNPELAEQYATRIINLKDGEIVSDSQPVEDSELVTSDETPEKTKLGFWTALLLSLNNLRTKKGRTFLTAFAGSVGIIGIALILALSNGVNEYIENIESQMLGSYPVTLEQATFDLESLMGDDMGMSIDTSNEDADSSSDSGGGDTGSSDDGTFSVNRVVGDSISATQTFMAINDLKSFKTYLDANSDKLENCTTSIEYSYDIDPMAYRLDDDYGVVTVSPAQLTVDSDTPMMTSMMTSGLTSSWSRLVDSQTLREQQYELLAGEWPSNENELALIISGDDEIDDYTLYTLGLMDITEMEGVVEAAQDGKEFIDTEKTFKYEDAIGQSYYYFAPAELYVKSEGVYIDKSTDEDYMKSHMKEGTKATITCVLRATEDASISSGIGYDVSMTEYLLEKTADTDVVKAQINSPDVSVLTGQEFSDDVADTYSLFGDMSSLSSYFTAKDSDDSIAPTYMGKYGDITPTYTEFTIPEGADFFSINAWMDAIVSSMLEEEWVQNAINQIINNYLDSMSADDIQAIIGEYAGSMTDEQISEMAQQYMESLSDEDIAALAEQFVGSMTEEDIMAMAEQYMGSMSEADIAALAEQYMGSMDMDVISQYLEEYMAENGDDLFAMIQESMDADSLASLIAQFTGSSGSTYDSVMETLCYYTLDEPSSISIYPSTLDGKEKIEAFIAEYNDQCESDAEKVTYTDYIAAVTSSITKIVNVISYVLIAFVAISLFVSSIMIAIITYISVLERTKEIGVLRALGSSKKDVSKIFNAETFIEGFFSGLLGVLVTSLLCIPANAIVVAKFNVHNIAHLPLTAAIILILISVILNLIAGYLPARMAAKKDPVLALRSE